MTIKTIVKDQELKCSTLGPVREYELSAVGI